MNRPVFEWECVACEMLGISDLDDMPDDIYATLYSVNEKVRKAGGELRSRQVIAAVITFASLKGDDHADQA